MVVQQLGGAILESLGQSAQQHGELRRVELKQSDQDHLSRLRHGQRSGEREKERERGVRGEREMSTESMQRFFKLNAHRVRKSSKIHAVFVLVILLMCCYKRK